MDSPESTPCRHCGTRPASHHLKIGEGSRTEILPLCNHCFELCQTAEAERAAVVLEHCNYCGSKAFARVSTIDQIIGGPGDRFGCERCHEEYHRFLLERLDAMNAELTELDNATQVEKLRQLYDETEVHMQQWVKQRDR